MSLGTLKVSLLIDGSRGTRDTSSVLTATLVLTVDSQLAKQSSLAAVSEILNGCM